MVNASTLLSCPPVRALMVGYPGSGKTGSIAPLLNAGFKVRFMDFDGNLEPLILNADPKMLANLDVLHFEDEMRLGQGFLEPAGIPTAFSDSLRALDDWKTEGSDGKSVSLGRSRDWGPDTIVVMDSLTSQGEAAHRRAMKLMNKTPLNSTDRVYGLAMGEQLASMQMLTRSCLRHHTLVIAHLKMIGPRDIRKGDTPMTEELKKRVADILPTRLYPSALGWQLPQQIGAEFPTLLEFVSIPKPGGKVKRVIRYIPREELDLKLPVKSDLGELTIEDGMLKVFAALSPGSLELVAGHSA